MKAIEYALLTVLVCVLVFLVITPIAHKTADRLNETTVLLEQYD